MDLTRESWEDGCEVKGEPVAEYMQRFREDLKTMMVMAQQNLTKSHAAQKVCSDHSTHKQSFDVGDLVPVLLPVKKGQNTRLMGGAF